MQKLKQQETLQKLNSKLSSCRKVIKTLETEGWKDIVQPLLDKMIGDIIGCKTGLFWNAGQIKKEANKEFKTEWLLGYRQAIIDINNIIWSYNTQLKNIENQIISLQKTTDEYIQPMSDSKYAPSGERL